MLYTSIWKRSAIAQQDLPACRFVDPWGNLGGDSGIIISSYDKGDTVPIITIGEAEVELHPDESVAIGDKVVGDHQGLAIKSTDNQGCIVLDVIRNKIKVLLR